MTPSKLDSFIQPPIRSLKRSLPSTIIQSPVKRQKSNTDDSLFLPSRKIKQPVSFNLIASNISTTKHRPKRSRSRQSAKSRKSKDDSISLQNHEINVENNEGFRDDRGSGDDGGFGDNGDFGDNGVSQERSPEKVNDILDWSVTSLDIDQLKAKIVPVYWESLLASVNSIVQVTERLYVLQDWNHKGHLKVINQWIMLIFIETSIQTCLSNG
jgi:hypothetical protein